MRTAAAMGTFLLCACCVAQQSQADRDSVLVTQPGFHVPRAKDSAEAYRVYDAINRARAALKAGNAQAAADRVRQALRATNGLRAAGHVTVPIYIELAENFNPAVPPPQTPDTVRFGAVDQPVDGQTTMLQYTAMSLDVARASEQLETAEAALSDGQTKAADHALAAAQNAVTFASVEQDRPLLRARQNLNLAAEELRSGAVEVAQTTLRTAARQLLDYAASGGTRSAEARQLASQIDSCADSLPAQHDQAGAQVEQFWDRAAALSGSGA